ncbi:MAG TPA: helix-turn-helix transcriptional regulator [Ktedonobacterales bacterium]|nr:helix-turn-helix transcriptional regulator [Ktedonobacterales bacterium]
MSELKKPDAPDQEQANEDWATRWGHMLRLARQVAGLSLQEVANRSGLSKGYLSKLESAHPSAANPSRATLAALARALPSSVPLIEKLDAEAGLPSPKTLLRTPQREAAGYQVEQAEEAEALTLALAEGGTEGLPASWAEWEIMLALMILENSKLGPPTLPVLSRACGVEMLDSKALARLENARLLQRLPPARPGEPIRYTQGPVMLDAFGIQRPADCLLRAAIMLSMTIRKTDHE